MLLLLKEKVKCIFIIFSIFLFVFLLKQTNRFFFLFFGLQLIVEFYNIQYNIYNFYKHF